MPRRRKGIEYCPEISVLLRSAQPTRAEILGEAAARKRRDLAMDRLVKMYSDAKKAGKIDQLDYRVRMFCKEMEKRNDGKLPKAKGGRPTAEDRRLLIAVHIEEAIEHRGRRRGSVKAAIEEVAKCDGVSHDHASDIYKDRDPDFRREVAVELELRNRKIHGQG